MTRDTLKTITVAELRELLDGEDDNALVLFSTDYGDHHHTPQALPLVGEIEETKISASAYSNSGFRLLDVDDSDDDDNPGEDRTEQRRQYLLIK